MTTGGGAGTLSAATTPPFLSKTYDMVDDPKTDDVVSWSKTSNSFVVWNVPEFSRDILPKYFKHSNFSSFVRQLNTYGFRKVDSDRWEFANEGFIKGHRQLLNTITRRKQQQQSNQSGLVVQKLAHPVQNLPAKSCIEVGKFGIEEEVSRLKRDKNVLMEELVMLRQQQQSTDYQLGTVSQRVHVMEQRLQQMMSFLANAMQSPSFVAQMVQQQSDSNRQISSSKKRSLPDQDEVQNYGFVSNDGQIVKYQPLMNEAAKAMLRKILKMDTSGSLEAKFANQNSFLIENGCDSSSSLDTSSSSNTMSGVTLAEVLPATAALSEIQSSSGLPLGMPQEALYPEEALYSERSTALPAFDQTQGFMLEKNISQPSGPQGPEVSGAGYVDAIPGSIDCTAPIASGKLPENEDFGMLPDDVNKLPGINDIFWEQFLTSSSLTGDSDDTNSENLGHGICNEELIVQAGELDKMLKMNFLTEQMGLLASASNVG